MSVCVQNTHVFVCGVCLYPEGDTENIQRPCNCNDFFGRIEKHKCVCVFVCVCVRSKGVVERLQSCVCVYVYRSKHFDERLYSRTSATFRNFADVSAGKNT